MEPKTFFSLVCRTVTEATAKDPARGIILPFLLLFQVVMRHRNLAYPHSALGISKLSNYLAATFQSAKFEYASESIAEAFQVSLDDLDLAPRVTVRSCSYCIAACFWWRGPLWHACPLITAEGRSAMRSSPTSAPC